MAIPTIQMLRQWWANRWVRATGLTLYYLGILIALVWIYGSGDFSTPKFIYQGF